MRIICTGDLENIIVCSCYGKALINKKLGGRVYNNCHFFQSSYFWMNGYFRLEFGQLFKLSGVLYYK